MPETNIYWYKAGADAHWDTVTGNWWDDAAHTVQAAAVPQIGDSVYLLGATAPDTGPAAPIEFFRCDTSGLSVVNLLAAITADITLSAGGFLTMGDPLSVAGNDHAWGGATDTTGTFVFNDHASNEGTVGDYAVFNSTSFNFSGVVGDYSTWNDETFNATTAVVGDYSTWNGESNNQDGGEVGDFATINSTHTQEGTWTGSTFNIGAAVEFVDTCEFTHVGASIAFELQNSAASVTGTITSDGGTTPIETVITVRPDPKVITI